MGVKLFTCPVPARNTREQEATFTHVSDEGKLREEVCKADQRGAGGRGELSTRRAEQAGGTLQKGACGGSQNQG